MSARDALRGLIAGGKLAGRAHAAAWVEPAPLVAAVDVPSDLGAPTPEDMVDALILGDRDGADDFLVEIDDVTERRILDVVARGAFDHVAASVAGVGPRKLAEWLADARPRYRAFAVRFERARAAARAVAEQRVWRESPERWLRYGPGRDTGAPDALGWATATSGQVRVSGRVQHAHAHLHAQARFDPSRLSDRELADLDRLISAGETEEEVLDVDADS